MARGKASGYTLTNSDARLVLGMIARGDRHHDIAAWFGVNQGRIAEVQDGSFGSISAAPPEELPPKGPPGIKGKRLRNSVEKALTEFTAGQIAPDQFVEKVQVAVTKYDTSET